MKEQPVHIVAVTVIVTQNGKVLLLKRSDREIAYPGLWTVPGGKVEIGESVTKALAREIPEETGLTLSGTPEYGGDFEFTRPDGIHVVGLRFHCEAEGKVKISGDFTDHTWVIKDNYREFDIIPNLKKDLEDYFKS